MTSKMEMHMWESDEKHLAFQFESSFTGQTIYQVYNRIICTIQ